MGVRFISKAAVLRAATVLIAVSLSSVYFGDFGGSESSAKMAVITTSFTVPVMVNDDRQNDQASPVIISTPDHRLYAAWQDMRSGNADIYFSKSLDYGITFTLNKRADDSNDSSQQTEPAIAVSGNGTILLVWQDNRRCTFDYDIFLTKSYDRGATFTRNVKADDSNGVISWQERPSIVSTSAGGIYIAWTDDRTGTMRVRGAFSTDGGETFSPSEEIVTSVSSTGGQTGVVLVSNFNRIYAAFIDNVSGAPHPYVCISTNGGRSFTNPVRLDSTGSSGIAQKGVTIAPMPGGGIVAAWDDSRNGDWDIYASIMSSHGTIMTSDIRVDDDPTGAWQDSASIVADQLGNVYATWTDERDALYAIRFAYLVAGEDGFNSSIEVARPGVNDIQRKSSLVVPEPGRVFVIWQDDRGGGTSHIYSSSANFPDLFGLSIKSGWNFISIPTVGHDYKASTLGLNFGDVVVGWNSTTQTYNDGYIVGLSPPEYDFSIRASTGYWVGTDNDVRIKLRGNIPIAKQYRQIAVPTGGGWDIIGFESLNVTRYASDVPAMLNIPGGVSVVAAYDLASVSPNSYMPEFPESDFELVPGQAYWCYILASGTLSYAP